MIMMTFNILYDQKVETLDDVQKIAFMLNQLLHLDKDIHVVVEETVRTKATEAEGVRRFFAKSPP